MDFWAQIFAARETHLPDDRLHMFRTIHSLREAAKRLPGNLAFK